MSSSVSDLRIAVGGAPLEGRLRAATESVEVRRRRGRPARCSVRFAAAPGTDWPWLDLFGAGEPVAAALGPAGGEQAVFDGECVGVDVTVDASGARSVTAHAADRSHRLWLHTRDALQLDGTLASVLGALAGPAGLAVAVDRDAPVPEWGSWGHSVGAQLEALCARAGLVADCEGTTIRLRPDGPSGAVVAEFTWGRDIERLEITETSARIGTQVRVLGWDRLRKERIDAIAGAGREMGGVDGGRPGSEVARSGFGEQTWFRTDQPVHDLAEAERLTEALLTKQAHAHATATLIVGGTPAARPGSGVALSGVGDASGAWRVEGVLHRFDRSGFRSTITLARGGSGGDA